MTTKQIKADTIKFRMQTRSKYFNMVEYKVVNQK